MERTEGGDTWVLVHPACVQDRAEDMEEVYAMIQAGATDVAIDELRWLTGECREFVEAHKVLGELARREDQDTALARGHFGVAYQLGVTALERAGSPAPNRPFVPQSAAAAMRPSVRHQPV